MTVDIKIEGESPQSIKDFLKRSIGHDFIKDGPFVNISSKHSEIVSAKVMKCKLVEQ